MANVLKIHGSDPNFPHAILAKTKIFLGESTQQKK